MEFKTKHRRHKEFIIEGGGGAMSHWARSGSNGACPLPEKYFTWPYANQKIYIKMCEKPKKNYENVTYKTVSHHK